MRTVLGEIEPDRSMAEHAQLTPYRIDICLSGKSKSTLESKIVITRFHYRNGADRLSSQFTLRAERSKKLSDTERITFGIGAFQLVISQRNCAGPAGSNVNRRSIRFDFRGVPIFNPVPMLV